MKEFKETIGMVLSHFFIITVCVMLVTATLDLIVGGVSLSGYTKYYPWIAMLTGLAGALPSFLFCFKNEPTKKRFYLRVVLHLSS